MSLFFYDPANKREPLETGVKARAPRVARAAKRHFILGKNMVPFAWAAQRSPSPSTLRESCRMGRRASIQLTRFDLGLAPRPSLYKNRRSRHPHKDYKIMSSILGSGTASEGYLSRSRHGAGK